MNQETTINSSNPSAIAFYEANVQNVANYGLSFFESREDRNQYNLGKKLVSTSGKAPVGSVKVTKVSTAVVTDDSVLDAILSVYYSGSSLDGNYKSVWGTLCFLLNVQAPWAHFRASQIARVGRRFESATSKTFDAVCPDLRAVGANWVGRVA